MQNELSVDGEGLMVKKTTHERSQFLRRNWSKGSSTCVSDRDAVIYYATAGAVSWLRMEKQTGMSVRLEI